MDFSVEMHHLHQAMDTRVSPAGAQRTDRLGRKTCQRLLQLVLDGLPRGLTLPALVSLSQVADTESQPHG